MDSPAGMDAVFEFDEFRLDTRRRLLFGTDAKPLPLTSKAYDTLAYLVSHRDQLIDKATLMQAVWPDVVVEENNLNQVITALRRVFGEQRGEHRFIVTVSGRGYRFVAQVRAAATAPDHAQPSIAVLPFVNLTGTEDKEYFGDGMAEELIHMLTRVPGLHVSSRTSSFAYKGHNTDIRAIARDLNVASVIEGSVRSAGERIRVTAQLINAQSGFHLWSQTFDRRFEDIFALQDELAAAIVAAVNGTQAQPPSPTPLRTPPTQDVEAYQLYLQGLALVHRGSESGARHARELLGEANKRDPRFARAIIVEALVDARLATEYSTGSLADVLQKCEARVQYALAIDPTLAEAEAVLGSICAHRLEWLRAEQHFAKAMQMQPDTLILGSSSLQPLEGYGFGVLQATGHLRQGRLVAERSFAMAPAVPVIVLMLSIAHAFEGNDSDALRFASLAEQMGWSEVPLPMILAQVAQRAGRFQAAGEYMQQAFPPAARASGMSQLVDLVYQAMGNGLRRAEALGAIQSLLAARPSEVAQAPSLSMLLMHWAVCLGDIDLAYRIGNHALDYFERSGCVPVASFVPQLWLPEMRPFRLDPRFHDFAALRLRMMDFWKHHGPPDGCELRNGHLAVH